MFKYGIYLIVSFVNVSMENDESLYYNHLKTYSVVFDV